MGHGWEEERVYALGEGLLHDLTEGRPESVRSAIGSGPMPPAKAKQEEAP